ncbi:MAG: hypothetical protein DRR19_01285 [Candidatus Parabeggiatoa sp. nov. 1]|nr:MAG: hypothetical protein DRR19_01285 [Gammaproteobacteria bacterium]
MIKTLYFCYDYARTKNEKLKNYRRLDLRIVLDQNPLFRLSEKYFGYQYFKIYPFSVEVFLEKRQQRSRNDAMARGFRSGTRYYTDLILNAVCNFFKLLNFLEIF